MFNSKNYQKSHRDISLWDEITKIVHDNKKRNEDMRVMQILLNAIPGDLQTPSSLYNMEDDELLSFLKRSPDYYPREQSHRPIGLVCDIDGEKLIIYLDTIENGEVTAFGEHTGPMVLSCSSARMLDPVIVGGGSFVSEQSRREKESYLIVDHFIYCDMLSI